MATLLILTFTWCNAAHVLLVQEARTQLRCRGGGNLRSARIDGICLADMFRSGTAQKGQKGNPLRKSGIRF